MSDDEKLDKIIKIITTKVEEAENTAANAYLSHNDQAGTHALCRKDGLIQALIVIESVINETALAK